MKFRVNSVIPQLNKAKQYSDSKQCESKRFCHVGLSIGWVAMVGWGWFQVSVRYSILIWGLNNRLGGGSKVW